MLKLSTDIQTVARCMVKALKKQGTYTEHLNNAILRASGDIVAYSKALMDLDDLKCTYYHTRSREGNEIYKIHPVVTTLPALSRSVENSLKAIGLTLGNLVLEDDPLYNLMEKVRGIDENED